MYYLIPSFALLATSIVALSSSSTLTFGDTVPLEEIRRSHDIPSLGVAKIANGVLTAETTGYRKWDSNAIVTKDDKWHLGSLTKSMTATLLSILIKDGLLRWDTHVKDAVAPGIKVHDDYRDVTLDMLTTHTSGINQSAQNSIKFMERMRNLDSHPMQGRIEWAKQCLSLPAVHRPGTQFNYSNTGYIILGHIMEHATNKSWEDLMMEKVWQPLGMDGCGFGAAHGSNPDVIEQPWPHKLLDDSVVDAVDPLDRYADNPKALGPAGTVHCTLDAWSKFLVFHMRGHNGRNIPIALPQLFFIKLHTAYLNDYTYGGWFATQRDWADRGRNLVLNHVGTNLKNYAVAWLDVEDEKAYVAVSNAAEPPLEGVRPLGGRAAKAANSAIEAVLPKPFLDSTQEDVKAPSPAGEGFEQGTGNRHDSLLRTKVHEQIVLPSA